MSNERTCESPTSAPVSVFRREEPNKNRLVIAGMVSGTVVCGILALTAPFLSTRTPLPYMATPSKKIRRALDYAIARKPHNRHKRSHIRSDNSSDSDRIFVDLGSGDGETVYQALQAGYTKAIGVELNWTLYFLSNARRIFFWPADYRRRSAFLRKDFFEYSVSGADTVMIFGVKPLMKSVSAKLATECKPGTLVLSYRFHLPISLDSTDASEESDSTKEQMPFLVRASLVYDEDEMKIYEVLRKTGSDKQ